MKAGRKNDAGKLPYHLMPWLAVQEIAAVLQFGADEYGPGNWRFVREAHDRYFAACLRHVVAWYLGEIRDTKSGRHHLAHAASDLLFLLWFDLAGAAGRKHVRK